MKPKKKTVDGILSYESAFSIILVMRRLASEERKREPFN
jgi:hypothetical protein